MMKIKTLVGLLVTTMMFNYCSYGIMRFSYKKICNENELIYEDEINDYDEFLEEYANYINSLNLNDLEIIIKVMTDTLNQIDGYGCADNLISGYYGLSFLIEGKGVCSSFADDFTRKMNKINPKYNARNVVVYVDEDKLCDQMLIPVVMNFADNGLAGEKVTNYIATAYNGFVIDKVSIIEYFFGNHMITVIEIPEYNLKLAVDPTNFIIGYFNDFKFDFFGNTEKNEMEYRDSTIIYSDKGLNNELKFLVESFCDTTISYEEIEDMYGYYAQEKAYDYVKELYPYSKRLKKN